MEASQNLQNLNVPNRTIPSHKTFPFIVRHLAQQFSTLGKDSWQRQDDKTEDSSYLIRRSRSHSSSWDRLICGMSSVLPPGKTKQTGTLSFPLTAQQVVSTVNTVNTSTYCSTVRLLMRDFCDERRHQFFSDPFFQNLSPSYFHVNQP